MRRNPKDPVYQHDGVKSVFPIFTWCKCEMCDTEFILEKGWMLTTGPFYGGVGVTKYICKECANTESEAVKFIYDNNLKYNPPKECS